MTFTLGFICGILATIVLAVVVAVLKPAAVQRASTRFAIDANKRAIRQKVKQMNGE